MYIVEIYPVVIIRMMIFRSFSPNFGTQHVYSMKGAISYPKLHFLSLFVTFYLVQPSTLRTEGWRHCWNIRCWNLLCCNNQRPSQVILPGDTQRVFVWICFNPELGVTTQEVLKDSIDEYIKGVSKKCAQLKSEPSRIRFPKAISHQTYEVKTRKIGTR